MRTIAATALVVVLPGCPAKKDDAGERTKPVPEQPRPKSIPALKPTGAPGVAPIASLPRADWPCARTVDSVGARITYDYTGAPAACSYPPDLWLPGCPTRHVQGNPDLGLEIEVRYRWDDQQRLIGMDSKLGAAAVSSITYDADKVVSQDVLAYYAVGDATQIWHDDGSLYAVVDHAAGPGIRRLRTSLESPDDPAPATDEIYEYEGARLARIRGKALGMTEIHAFEYDCK